MSFLSFLKKLQERYDEEQQQEQKRVQIQIIEVNWIVIHSSVVSRLKREGFISKPGMHNLVILQKEDAIDDIKELVINPIVDIKDWYFLVAIRRNFCWESYKGDTYPEAIILIEAE